MRVRRFALLALVLAPLTLATVAPASATTEAEFCASREEPPEATSETTDQSSAANAARKREAFREHLREHYCWYVGSKAIYGTLWIGGTLAVVVLTSLTAYLVAIDFADKNPRRRMVLAALPAAAALVTALLGQFRVQEIWELREAGRIETYALLDRLRLVRAESGREMDAALAPLRKRLLEIEAAQAGRFFSYIGGKPDAGAGDPAGTAVGVPPGAPDQPSGAAPPPPAG